MTGNVDYESGWLKITVGDIYPEAYYTAVNLALWICVSRNQAEVRRELGIPSYRYRYYPIFPDTEHPYNVSLAIHGSDVITTWGTMDDAIKIVSSTADERSLSKLHMTNWATFAKDPVSGLANAGWPKFDTDVDSLAQLGYNGVYNKLQFTDPKIYDSACPTANTAFCLSALSS